MTKFYTNNINLVNRRKLGCKLVKQAMTRNRFTVIKQKLHLANNDCLMEGKATKVMPLIDVVNKLKQFAIFSKFLCIDQKLCHYVGHTPLKCIMRKNRLNLGTNFGFYQILKTIPTRFPIKFVSIFAKVTDLNDRRSKMPQCHL